MCYPSPILALIGICLLCLTISGYSNEPAVQPDTTAATIKHLHQRIPELMQANGIPGLSIALIADAELAWIGHYGVANIETGIPVTADTLFEAASLSKPILAYLVLGMVERGELSLDTHLFELLPYSRFDNAPEALLLTPRLVLSHQSGLPNWGGEPLKFKFEPGSRFGYSGEAYVYLQKVVEAQTGLTLQTLAQQQVFDPLGMTNSKFTWSEDTHQLLATGHNNSNKPQHRSRPEASAASSLHTTATDYARFMLAWLNTEGIAPQSIETAYTAAVKIQSSPDESAHNRHIIGWGLGWGIQHSAEPLDKVVWHWGDNGVFKAFMALQPGTRNGVVFFTNSVNGLEIAQPIAELVVGDVHGTFNWLDEAQSGHQLRRILYLAILLMAILTCLFGIQRIRRKLT